MTDAKLRSEDLRAALTEALAGRPDRLRERLARHGGLPGPRPNLALAEAFGEAVREGRGARALLDALREEPEEDGARTFLPIAAAYGYAARLSTDARHAWTGLFELAADDRTPVRIGLTEALRTAAARGQVDVLLGEARDWLDTDDREHVYASQAIVLDVIAPGPALEPLADPAVLLGWLSAVLDLAANAKRADERSPARRRLLAALPGALASAANALRKDHDGAKWLEAEIARYDAPDLRAVFDRTLALLRRGTRAESLEPLEAALASTKKAPRDPTLIRDGRGRGKRTRRRR